MDPWPAMEHHARRLTKTKRESDWGSAPVSVLIIPLKVYNLINHQSILTLSYVCIDKVFFIW